MLSIGERLSWLKSVVIFASTPESVLSSLAQMLEEVRIPSGDTLMQEGEPGDCMYIVVEGELHAYALGKHVGSFAAGEIVGEMAVLDLEPRSASVVAICDTHLFRLGRNVFDQAMSDQPEIAKGIIRMLVHRLRIREDRLQSEIQQLRIEVDKMKQLQQVSEVTESDFFANLQTKAQEMRSRRRKI